MKNKLAQIIGCAFIVGALAGAPAIIRAADSTNAPASETPKKPGHLPFHGKVASADSAAMTFTVGTMTIAITSTTKITKDGKPAVFADIAVGAAVSGSYKKDADGKLNATSVKVGAPKKKDASAAAPAAQ